MCVCVCRNHYLIVKITILIHLTLTWLRSLIKQTTYLSVIFSSYTLKMNSECYFLSNLKKVSLHLKVLSLHLKVLLVVFSDNKNKALSRAVQLSTFNPFRIRSI